jgi:hypothetical protein
VSGYYVCIDGIELSKLEFLGYSLIRENDEFEIWSDLTGDEHIIAKGCPRYLYMEDLNDAIILGAVRVTPAPHGSENSD